MVQENDEQEPEQVPVKLIVRPGTRVYVRPDTHAIADTVLSMSILGENIRTLLTPDVDYGQIPGVSWKMLFDCGASKLINAYNCYAGERRVIHFVDDGSKISIMVEVPLIDRMTGQVVQTGIGAASTLETKHKYRWITDPEELIALGYGDEVDRKQLRCEIKNGIARYRVPNPEHGDLLNTITKMASKRAEVDAAESLPGVGSTLKPLFKGQLGPAGGRGTQRPPLDTNIVETRQEGGDDWSRFWGEIMRMGLTRDQVLDFFKTKSMGNYATEKQKTHQDLLHELREALKEGLIK